jgi:uncharacterized membrane protein AbrB (regulator of aidB expression)
MKKVSTEHPIAKMISRPLAISILQILCTLFVGYIAALVCVWLQTPIPWMIGPLLITAGLSIFGVKTLSWGPFRNGGQWIIATALGLYFTPQVSTLVASLWWLVILSISITLRDVEYRTGVMRILFEFCLKKFRVFYVL